MPAKRGFTLVELLIVIAIISVLMAMLLPAMENAMESARKVDCQNRMRQLITVSHQYEAEYHVILPPYLGYYQTGMRQEGANLLWDAGLLEHNLVVIAEGYYLPTAKLSVVPGLRAQSIFMCPSGVYTGGGTYIFRNGNYNALGLEESLWYNVRDNICQWGEDRSRTFTGWNPQFQPAYLQGEYPAWNPYPERNKVLIWGAIVSYQMNQALSNTPGSWDLNTVWKPIKSYSEPPSKKIFFMEAWKRHSGVAPVTAGDWQIFNSTYSWKNTYFKEPHLTSMNYVCHDGHVGSIAADPITRIFYIDTTYSNSNTGTDQFVF